jgi:hypothetical protein
MTMIRALLLMLGLAFGFPSTTAEYAGGVILSMFIPAMIGLALIGWMQFVFVIVVGVVVGVLFAKRVRTGLGV